MKPGGQRPDPGRGPADFFDLFQIEWVRSFLAAYPQVRMEFVLDDAEGRSGGEGIDVALRAAHLVDDNLIGHKIIATQLIWSQVLRTSPLEELLRRSHRWATTTVCHSRSHRPGDVAPEGPEASEIQVSSRFRANTARAVLRRGSRGFG